MLQSFLKAWGDTENTPKKRDGEQDADIFKNILINFYCKKFDFLGGKLVVFRTLKDVLAPLQDRLALAGMGCIDTGIRKSEFVAKTPFLFCIFELTSII